MNKPLLFCAASALAAFAGVASAQVDLKVVGTDHVSVTINGQPFSDFYIGNTYAKPFLSPLRTASGLIVTRQWPMQKVEGESNDHPHHKGLWIGFGAVNDVNFWEVEEASKPSGTNPTLKGTVALKNLDSVTPGKKSGSVAATFTWRAPDHGDMIEERRVLTFYAYPDVRTIDVDTTLTAKVPVTFGDTKEGFFAIRLADSMAEKNGGMMTNSEGAQT
jgi:hypothetical protein